MAVDVIAVLESNFADYGIPELLYSDNGSQYANAEFMLFSQRMRFKNII